MTTRAKPLVTSKYVAASDTTEYTAPVGIRTTIDKLTVYNASSANVNLTVRLVPSGVVSATSHTLAYRALAPNETTTLPEIVGHVLEAGGALTAFASAANSLIMRVSGREST